MIRLVRVSGNTGRVLKVYGVNFSDLGQVTDFAYYVLGLPRPDLDQSPTWACPNGDVITTQPMSNLGRHGLTTT